MISIWLVARTRCAVIVIVWSFACTTLCHAGMCLMISVWFSCIISPGTRSTVFLVTGLSRCLSSWTGCNAFVGLVISVFAITTLFTVRRIIWSLANWADCDTCMGHMI